MIKVQVLICSRDRIQTLSNLLRVIARHYAFHTEFEVSVLLVDASEVRYDLSELERQITPLDFQVVICQRAGVVSARNIAMQNCDSSADYFAFIDDDEYPAPGWLEALITLTRKNNHVAVGGPVKPIFPEKFKRTPLAPFYFHGSHVKKGIVKSLATGNLLLTRQLFLSSEFQPYFDERLNYSGSEDTEFSERARAVFGDEALGWSESAIVFEEITENRITISWLLRRGFNLGQSRSTLKRIQGESIFFRLLSIVINFVRSLFSFAVGAIRGRFYFGTISMLYFHAIIMGQFAGLFGFNANRYGSK